MEGGSTSGRAANSSSKSPIMISSKAESIKQNLNDKGKSILSSKKSLLKIATSPREPKRCGTSTGVISQPNITAFQGIGISDSA